MLRCGNPCCGAALALTGPNLPLFAKRMFLGFVSGFENGPFGVCGGEILVAEDKGHDLSFRFPFVYGSLICRISVDKGFGLWQDMNMKEGQ
jgi:hypothetical protein